MDVFVARQPILDRSCDIYAYELLYRDGSLNCCNAASLDFASSKVIGDSFLLMGFDSLTRGRPVFLNVTERVVSEDYLALLPKHAVIEILETVRPTPAVIESCRRLKSQGFRIALDDFVYDPSLDPLIDLADVIKLDWLLHEPDKRRRMVPWLRSKGLAVLAEKVETWKEFEEASELGCDYFQGYFFSKPEVLKSRQLPALELLHLQLIRELGKRELDFGAVESLVKREVSLTYKLLRYINSAAVGLRNEVESIRHAIVLLGEKEFRRWAMLATVASVRGDKPEELMTQASFRGRLGELLAPELGMRERDQELFLLGMLSLLDAFLDRPLDVLLRELGVTKSVEAALLRGEGDLAAVLRCIMAVELGDWDTMDTLCVKLGIGTDVLAAKYIDAVSWADRCDTAGDEREVA